MAWTWDTTAVWHRDERKERHADPLARFITTVDYMFYTAAAAFAISIIALLIA